MRAGAVPRRGAYPGGGRADRRARAGRIAGVGAAAVTIPAVITLAVGCRPQTPDYESLWTTSTTTATSSTTAPPEPLAQYLDDAGVTGEQVAPDTLTDLTVSIPTPPGWQPYHNPNITPATEMIAKDDSYPTAMLMVFELTGDVDTAEAIEHGYADAELSQNFTRLNASTADFHGFPSAMIEGSYDLKGTRLHSWNRVVFATGAPPANQHYLVQLTVTTLADQAVADSSGVQAIINGFNVAAT